MTVPILPLASLRVGLPFVVGLIVPEGTGTSV